MRLCINAWKASWHAKSARCTWSEATVSAGALLQRPVTCKGVAFTQLLEFQRLRFNRHCRASESSSSKQLHAEVAGEDDDTPDASLRGGERAENGVAQPSMSQHSMTQQAGERSVGLRCLAASSDGYVFAGFHSGHLKCYTALGRLVWKKVPAQVPQQPLKIPPA